ncbi:hypothetical protein HNY73_019176 [Argiope bruennichi]|uniref:Tc1-like transposase DDE domain-containing protein n=1 Tax=Argiope bruennichi TaxID=94029 RepID=A0A8T0EIU0_ARGBR|nr:hypothetical protein HNY73_019176 [Argiope bruennichi]
MLQEYDFQIFRLPPYHCDINAIEYIWANIKRQIREINPTADMEMNKLFRETEEAIYKTSNDRWQFHCKHVEKLEKKYWEKDAIIEEMYETLQISLINEEESDSECDSEATLSAESEEDDI